MQKIGKLLIGKMHVCERSRHSQTNHVMLTSLQRNPAKPGPCLYLVYLMWCRAVGSGTDTQARQYDSP